MELLQVGYLDIQFVMRKKLKMQHAVDQIYTINKKEVANMGVAVAQ